MPGQVCIITFTQTLYCSLCQMCTENIILESVTHHISMKNHIWQNLIWHKLTCRTKLLKWKQKSTSNCVVNITSAEKAPSCSGAVTWTLNTAMWNGFSISYKTAQKAHITDKLTSCTESRPQCCSQSWCTVTVTLVKLNWQHRQRATVKFF